MRAFVLLAGLLFFALAPAQEVPEEVLKEYRLALAGKMAGVREYPKAALERKIQGTSVVQLSIGSNGRIRSARVDPSSGSEALDTEALEMVMAAHPQVALPESLRGRSFSVAVPVLFKIPAGEPPRSGTK
jgi:protein TonB